MMLIMLPVTPRYSLLECGLEVLAGSLAKGVEQHLVHSSVG